jgi:hypothetical protein
MEAGENMTTISGTSSIQGTQGMEQMRGPRGGGKALTDAQKTQITDILSSYDSSNITQANAKEIFQKFNDAGIQPGRGMKETIEAAGFDAEKLRELGMPADFQMRGGPQGGRRQPPPISDAQKTTVTDILSKYDPTNLSTTDVSSILTAFREAGIGPAKGLKETIDSAGFNSDSILKMPQRSSGENNFWASQSASQSIDLSTLQSLQSILNKYNLSSMSMEEQNSLTQQLQTTSLFKSSSINLSA